MLLAGASEGDISAAVVGGVGQPSALPQGMAAFDAYSAGDLEPELSNRVRRLDVGAAAAVADIRVMPPKTGALSGMGAFDGLMEAAPPSKAAPRPHVAPKTSAVKTSAVKTPMAAELQVVLWRGDVAAMTTFITRQGSLQAATVQSADRFGCSPLHIAALAGQATAVQAMVDMAAALDARASAALGGATPLLLAAIGGSSSTDAALSLLDAGAAVDATLAGGVHVAHVAAWSGAVDLLQQLLLRHPECHATTSERGLAPVHYAALSGQRAAVEMLLRYPADDAATLPALHCAALGGDADCVALVLQRQPEDLASWASGWQPLHFAAAVGACGALAQLLAHRADVDAPDEDGLTPLHLACAGGHADCVAALLEATASVDAATRGHECTALSYAAVTADEECLRLLTAAGARTDEVERRALQELTRAMRGDDAAAVVVDALA